MRTGATPGRGGRPSELAPARGERVYVTVRRKHPFVARVLLCLFGLDAAGAQARPMLSPPAATSAPGPGGQPLLPIAPTRPAAAAVPPPSTNAPTAEPFSLPPAGSCAEALRDGRAPTASVVKSQLWPADHVLVNVGLAAAPTSDCVGLVSLHVSVWSDEPDEDQTGDGNQPFDARLDPPDLYLR